MRSLSQPHAQELGPFQWVQEDGRESQLLGLLSERLGVVLQLYTHQC